MSNPFKPLTKVTIAGKGGVYTVATVKPQGRGFTYTVHGAKGSFPGRDVAKATPQELRIASEKALARAARIAAKATPNPTPELEDPNPIAPLPIEEAPTPISHEENA